MFPFKLQVFLIHTPHVDLILLCTENEQKKGTLVYKKKGHRHHYVTFLVHQAPIPLHGPFCVQTQLIPQSVSNFFQFHHSVLTVTTHL